MFKIVSLTLYPEIDRAPYTYDFSEGINYFWGRNDSGKTEFYIFLDYMFGAKIDLYHKDWYYGTLSHAKMVIQKDEIHFVAERYLKDINKNYFYYEDEEPGEVIRSDEYRMKLGRVFSPNQEALRELQTFIEEDVSYRTCTMFNFLGEKRQGILQDFLDKASDVKYAIKLPGLLNYIFNKNIARIEELKKEEIKLKAQLEVYEKTAHQNDEAKARVNAQLKIIGLKKVFNGQNSQDILDAIDEFQTELTKQESTSKYQAITELEAVYTSLDEQIKKQSNFERDHRAFENDDNKQVVLLEKLGAIIEEAPAYAYLAEPIVKLTEELRRSISFNKFFIQESTTRELKKRREEVRQEIVAAQSRYKIYSASEKTKAITLVREYLGRYKEDFDADNVSVLKRELQRVREEIRVLQNSNDTEKIAELSYEITRLYEQTKAVSALSDFDFQNKGFYISYIKNGNILQPKIEVDEEEGVSERNYYTGSMARHTLIQLCGYLAFLKMLIKEKKYPVIPILIIDHISKPFDAKNEIAIGKVLHATYDDVPQSDLQIILFEDEDSAALAIQPNHATELVEEGKSGFNPYYFKEPVPEEQELADEEKEKTSE